MAALPNFPEFELLPRETAPIRFDRYVRKLDNLFMAMDIADPKRKKAMFLHYTGEQTVDVFETLTVPIVDNTNTALDDVHKCAVHAVRTHLEPQRSIDHLVYSFRKQTQESGENVNEFYTRLVLLARRCDFRDADLEIKRQIIQGTHSNRLRRKAIENSLSLEKLLKSARAMELADEHTSDMQKSERTAQANFIRSNKRYSYTHGYGQSSNSSTTCGLCGGQYPHKGVCPAKGKECKKCNRMNHFAKMCRSSSRSFEKPRDQNSGENVQKDSGSFRRNGNFGRTGSTNRNRRRIQKNHKARAIDCDEDDVNDISCVSYRTDSDDEYLFHIGTPTNTMDSASDKPFFNVTISGMKVRVMADSGATVNILNYHDYCKLSPQPPLVSSKTKIFPYMSKEPLFVCGKFQTKLKSDKCECSDTFYVVKGPSSSLISWKTSQKLNLIKVANSVANSSTESSVPDFLSEFPNVTNGMGACKGDPVKVYVDPSVKPTIQPHRRIPFQVRKKVEAKIKELEDADIIERAEGPTPWVSPIVVVPKPKNPDEIRICVDMRSVNRAIICERHVIPTIDDIAAELNGCTVFSKIDLKQGYHQILLHPDSRFLTTFSTHTGLWRYKRLHFGMSCSAEIFQKIVSDVVSGIPKVKNISDDIYVGGLDSEDHDRNLRLMLQRLSEHNLTINVPKSEFRVPSMIFFGHRFSAKGISRSAKGC
jgi:hypothetical protein